MDSAMATVNGIRMHYRRAGEGPPLVLLHGWPQTWPVTNDLVKTGV
jgi:pimeloyl-ACP methyl ester carboxylesterase